MRDKIGVDAHDKSRACLDKILKFSVDSLNALNQDFERDGILDAVLENYCYIRDLPKDYAMIFMLLDQYSGVFKSMAVNLFENVTNSHHLTKDMCQLALDIMVQELHESVTKELDVIFSDDKDDEDN